MSSLKAAWGNPCVTWARASHGSPEVVLPPHPGGAGLCQPRRPAPGRGWVWAAAGGQGRAGLCSELVPELLRRPSQGHLGYG